MPYYLCYLPATVERHVGMTETWSITLMIWVSAK